MRLSRDPIASVCQCVRGTLLLLVGLSSSHTRTLDHPILASHVCMFWIWHTGHFGSSAPSRRTVASVE
jgi:hypothetical protein